LLLTIAEWFHAIHARTFKALPVWLKIFRDQKIVEGDTIISFNWGLILDQLFFDDEVNAKSYGLRRGLKASVTLLKPHGSLNWYDGDQGARIKQQLRFPLHTDAGGQKIYAFMNFRSPRSKNKYMLMIIPPVYNKDFSHHVLRDLWRSCVASLSAASKVVFLGYSLPEPDLHARFILRCGFHNQVEAGQSQVVIVNPDQGAASRIERSVGHHVRCDWQPMPVAEWIDQQSL
jgi:hypothetical protein